MPDITMSVDETLEVDAVVEEWSNPDSTLDFNGDKSSFDLSGIQTKTSIINPQQPGTYTITVNGQELSVEVIGTNAVPDDQVLWTLGNPSPPYTWDNGFTLETYESNGFSYLQLNTTPSTTYQTRVWSYDIDLTNVTELKIETYVEDGKTEAIIEFGNTEERRYNTENTVREYTIDLSGYSGETTFSLGADSENETRFDKPHWWRNLRWTSK